MALVPAIAAHTFTSPEELLYGEDVPRHIRFNGADGADRVNSCNRMCLDPADSDVTVKWYLENLERAIVRHPLNQRNSKSHKKRLVASLLKHGLVYAIRRICWTTWGEAKSWPLLSFTWGSLIDACYEVMEKHGRHLSAIRIREDGLKHVAIYTYRQPKNVLMWMKNFHN